MGDAVARRNGEEKKGCAEPVKRVSAFPMAAGSACFEKALERASAENLAIVSNRRMSGILLDGSDGWKEVSHALPGPTSTIIAYVQPGRKLGDVLRHTRGDGTTLLLDVPAEYRNEKDAALVVEFPYQMERNGGERESVIRAATIELIRNFPAEDGWYLGDPVHDIPFGSRIEESDPSARRLWRVATWVGNVGRILGNTLYDARRDIHACDLSVSHGYVAEAP